MKCFETTGKDSYWNEKKSIFKKLNERIGIWL